MIFSSLSPHAVFMNESLHKSILNGLNLKKFTPVKRNKNEEKYF